MAFRNFLLGLLGLAFIALASAQADCAFGAARFQIAQTYRISDPPALDASSPNYCVRLAGLDNNPNNVWLFSCSDPRSSAFVYFNAANSTMRIYGTLIGGRLENNSTLGPLTPFYMDFVYRNLVVDGQSLRIPFSEANGGTFFDLDATRSVNLISVRSDSTFELQPPSPGIVGRGQISVAGVNSPTPSEIRIQFGACSDCNCGIDRSLRLPAGFGFSGAPCDPNGCIEVIVVLPPGTEGNTPVPTTAPITTPVPTTVAPTTAIPTTTPQIITTVPVAPAPTETPAATKQTVIVAPPATQQTVIVAPAPTIAQTVQVVPVNTVQLKNAAGMAHFNIFAILSAVAVALISFY